MTALHLSCWSSHYNRFEQKCSLINETRFELSCSGTATAFYFYRIATGNTPKISEQ
jgi:hypothetical protein